MKKNKRILASQDKSMENFLTNKKACAYVDLFEHIKTANLDVGTAFNTFSKVLPNYMMIKNEVKNTSDEVNNAPEGKANFIKNYVTGKAIESLIKPIT